MKSSVTIGALLALGCLVSRSGAQCEGPATADGSSYCVGRGFFGRLLGQYQWQTCVRSSYLSAASNGTRICAAGQGLCAYKCQDELMDVHKEFDVEKADVTEACRCDPNAVMVNATTLPAKCFTPTGIDCTWHDECVQSKFKCDWANMKWSKLASSMCQLFQTHKNDFDVIGQRWISGVGKCLHDMQVPFLRPYVRPLCEALTTAGPKIQELCYRTPGGGAPNLCDVGFVNWIKVVGTVRETVQDEQNAMHADPTKELRGLDERIIQEGTALIKECGWDISHFKILKMRLKALDLISKISSISKMIADQLRRQLEVKFGIGLNKLLIFPLDFAEHRVGKRNADAYNTNVFFLITSKQLYDLRDADSSSSLRMAPIFEYLEKSVSEGTLKDVISFKDAGITKIEVFESFESGRPVQHGELPDTKLMADQIALLVILILIILSSMFGTFCYCMRRRNGLYKEKYIQMK
ncbi:uncharacterized protein LOC127845861 [Dreissena polymorpha]|uniref:Uncharacterized protein n=1 Tax=Dreissena polymorpha TaxID=45954 RepID=A0A9D4IDN9_DREPO|nr:uncharacterized protein LOC127845861 [Dreissena polymorpha]KAH3771531.1 hypothetical protein DPMN_172854 [Dreissena polymorpha]